MEKLIYKLILDLDDDFCDKPINIRCGDESVWELEVTLQRAGVLYPLSGIDTVMFRAEKPDGTMLLNLAEVDGDVLRYTLDDQCTAAEGILICQFTLNGTTEGSLSTPQFCVAVGRLVVGPETVESVNEYLALVKYSRRAQMAAEQSEVASEQALTVLGRAEDAIARANDAASAADEAAEKAEEAATGDISERIVTFTEGEGTEIPVSGETVSVIAGKLAGSVRDFDERLKNTAESMGNGVFTSDEEVEDFTFETELDADTLGGNAPEYYATAADVGDVSELKTDEKSVVGAINEVWSNARMQWGVAQVGGSDSCVVTAGTFYDVAFADSAGLIGGLVTFADDSRSIFRFNKTGVYRISIGSGGTINDATITAKIISGGGTTEYQKRSFMNYGCGDMFLYVTDTTAFYLIQIASDTAGTLYGDTKFSRVVIEKIM